MVVYLDVVGIGGDFFARRLEVVPQADNQIMSCDLYWMNIEIHVERIQK